MNATVEFSLNEVDTTHFIFDTNSIEANPVYIYTYMYLFYFAP